MVCYIVLVIYIFTIIKIVKAGKAVSHQLSQETCRSREFLTIFLRFIYVERETEREREKAHTQSRRAEGKKLQADSSLSAQPNMGLDLLKS